jgi:site-specific recombinase XerD
MDTAASSRLLLGADPDDDWPTLLWPAMERWQEIRLGFGTLIESTAASQLPVLQSFARFVGPEFPVANIKPSHCVRWQASLLARRHNRRGPDRQLQPSTINRMTSCVRAFFRDQHDLGLIQRNPWLRVPYLPEPGSEGKALSDEEVDLLLTAADRSGVHAFRNRTVVLLMLWTGLRVSEVCRLRADQYDPERRVLVGVLRSKTRKVEDVFVVGPAEAQLQAWLRFGRRGRETAALIPSLKATNAGFLRPDTMSGILSALFDEAGVDGTGHALRHTFLTRLANAGAPIHVVMRAAGHASMASSQQYLNATDSEVCEAIERLAS